MERILTQTFKWDQVERSIADITSRIAGGTSPAITKGMLKRLVDNDRNPKARLLDWSQDHYAFFDGPPPGRGVEVAYSAYHAFALLTALRLLQGGLPQGTAVKFLREVRPELEAAFTQILADGPATFCPGETDEEREQLIRDGLLVGDPERLRFLVAESGARARPIHVARREGAGRAGNVCANTAVLFERLRFFSHDGKAAIVLELVNAAFQLTYWLARAPLRKRGRS